MTPSIPIPEGSVVITPFQMYQEQQEMNKTLNKVATSVDSVVGKLDHYQEDQARRMDAIDGKDGVLVDHGRRITSLERWRWIITGGVTALGSAGGIAIYQSLSKH